MIVTEAIEINGKEFIKNYSDKNLYIQKTGTDEVYSEAIDLPESNFIYEETDKEIEGEENV